MTRISDLGLQQALIAGFRQNQGASTNTQTQISSGDRSQTYAGLGRDAVALVNAEGLVARSDGFLQNSQVAINRSARQSLALDTISDQLSSLRQAVGEALSTGDSRFLGDDLGRTVLSLVDPLNDEIGGQFIFGGVQNAIPPVRLGNNGDDGQLLLGEVEIAHSPATSLRVGAEQIISGGPVAADFAPQLFETLRALEAVLQQENNDGQDGLSENSRAALQNIAQNLDENLFRVGVLSAEVGINQRSAQTAARQNNIGRDLAQLVAADIEDVDIAEALSRLSQDQLAVQAAGQALAIATQTTILNFI